MMKKILLTLGLLLFVAPAFAADIDGTWTGTLSTPGGDVAVKYTFKAQGNVLTGTASSPDGSDVAIKNGKVDGGKISFSVDADFNGSTTTMVYSGVHTSDDLKMHLEFMNMPLDFVLKKAS
jgi:hypothetical protein